MDYRITDQRSSSDVSNRERDVPSFIEPRPPLILNPFMRPRPQKGTNLLELFEEDDSVGEGLEEAPELVQVYLRLKPSNVPSNLYEVRSDQHLITSLDTATAGHGRRTQHNVSKMYTFSHIFGPDAHQKEIFEHVVKGNLRRLPDGHSFTLLTYGASGSGKTYTLMGTVKAPGLVPRSLEYVFKVVDAAQMPLYQPGESNATKLSLPEQEYELQRVRQLRHVSAPVRDKYRRMSTRLCRDLTKSTIDLSGQTKHYLWVSFVEIYNEAIYDLLVPTERTTAPKLKIREDPSGNVYVKGATQAFVRSGEEAYDVLVAGKHNLHVHATGVHAHSSRSHCIFTITMLTETGGGVRSSYVRLCDLAGSERARRTRNTGVRMAESCAINSSLHVLERCLHMLRRKKAGRVPYRESKLTRLLGAGLSGARGEAVSMVVTLNPAPAYAQETKHVLQLAAVARDIQVNNTIAESISTLEISSQNTTIADSADLIRLRADNERLHYELVQAQALNKKMMSDMAEQREENALTVRELVDEARDVTQQYFLSQIARLEQRHEDEMAELREEYEAKIALLEEELNAERLARARMNEELLHLRECIEERDEKSSDDNSNQEDVIQLTDESDGECDEADDACNDSLEPTFKKEDIKRTRRERMSLLNNTHNNTFDSIKNTDNINNTNTCDNNHDTLKDESVTDNDMTDTTYDESKRDSTMTDEKTDETYDVSQNESQNQSIDCPATVKKAVPKEDKFVAERDASCDSSKEFKHSARETYFVSNSDISKSGNAEKRDSIQKSDMANSVDTDICVSMQDDEDLKDYSIISDINIAKPVKRIETQIEKIKRFAISSVSSDSLAQFELLELEVNDSKESEFKYFDDGTGKKSVGKSPRKKEKKPYFDDIQPTQTQISKLKDMMNLLRSPSIVQDEMPDNYELTTINKIMRESFTVNTDVPPLLKNKILLKMHDSIDPFEEVDSPCVNKDKELKSTEEVRKLPENVSLFYKDIEIKSEPIDEMVENEVNNETKAVIPEEANSDKKALEVPSAPEVKQNDKVDSETELKLNLLAEIKQEPTDADTMNMNIEKESETEVILNEIVSLQDITNANQTSVDNNTIDAFENIYKDISLARPTDFNLLVTENCDSANNNQTREIENALEKNSDSANDNQTMEIENAIEKIVIATEDPEKDNNSRNKKVTIQENSDKGNNNHELTNETTNDMTETNKVKYNLRHKVQEANEKDNENEILVENTAKCAPRTAKKSLRLRKRNRAEEQTVEEDAKLKDIVNLQKEFSDVTLGVPAPEKMTKDRSPENSEGENQPPLIGGSCPSKSVTRSRRKLFTPRAEPLEESSPAGDSSERVRVPRPSYHRATRTRRRLN